MKSFRCFEDYSENLLSLFKELQKSYFAHLSHDKSEKETLLEHSKLVTHYCLKIIENQKIESLVDSIIEKLIQNLAIENQEDFGNIVKESFIAAIAYHDLGKVNPNFQFLKMENELFTANKNLSLKYYHSFLGSYIYVNLFLKKIFENEHFKNEEKLLLYFIILLFSSTIAKHHNSTIDVLFEFDIKNIDDSYTFLNTYTIKFAKFFSQNFYTGAEKILEGFNNLVKEKNNIYFDLFAITKLQYSLLTASDFYATNEFMSKIKIDEFGILDNETKSKLIKNFRIVKPYNKDLYSNLSYYQTYPFDKLTERTYQNLNILRQKLTVEMILNLRGHPENRCFYIEAPTGAGKTNLSLAFATELLSLDSSINKLFYVFPFTTLITQTFKSIKETLEIGNDSVIQLHSKAGFHEKDDGTYGNEKQLFIDNLFVNYPIALLSHIRFFDILKGNEKESNYLLHRLCNSIVIIDEIQTYNPEHWDKIVYFLANYADLFNIRVLIMSATLPKIDALHENLKGSFVSLITNREKYFTNQNFAGRVLFDFTLADKGKPNNEEKKNYLIELSVFMVEKAEQYAESNNNKVKVLIEFITKKTATQFFSLINKDSRFENYKILMLSGDILEFRREQIINSIKEQEYPKVIVVSTQVVEAGVDIDMDLGFKDRSLIDSDEQLAGRINRNASKDNCVVYLFDCDKTSTIYGSDNRYKVQQTDKEIFDDYKEILIKKRFHSLYEKVFDEKRKRMNSSLFAAGHYYQYFADFNFSKLHKEFQLIENNDSQQLFIPIQIPVSFFGNNPDLMKMNVLSEDMKYVDGSKVFEFYEKLIHCEFNDFSLKQIEMKKLGSIMAQFCISIYKKQLETIADMLDPNRSKYGYCYLLNWNSCYSPKYGFDSKKIDTSIFP